MAWVKLTSGFGMHRKVRPLSDAAFRLHVSAMCFSAENGTDGRISADDLALVSDVRRPGAAAEELYQRNLWEAVETGWLIHDYLQYNLSAEEGAALSLARAEAGKRGGKAKANHLAFARQGA